MQHGERCDIRAIYTGKKCDPTAQNELHWYSVTMQSATICDLQVKNIDFWFSSKLGASGIFLFKNITFNGQMWCLMTVSGILNGNCCNTVVCETNFLSPVSQNGTLRKPDWIINNFWTCRQICVILISFARKMDALYKCVKKKKKKFMKSINVTHFGG